MLAGSLTLCVPLEGRNAAELSAELRDDVDAEASRLV